MIQLGTLIDAKYKVDGHIGEGGMGFVVSATHQQLGTKVAIKFLHGHAAAIPEFVTRFEREARAASTLASNHVARILDVGSHPQLGPYMVMEYLVGRDLGAELEARGRLPFDEVISYTLQACEALAHAHRARIVHRDLKPANLFLAEADGSKTVKLLDFGISKSLDPETESQLTATSSMLGTALYMAPEQLRRRKDIDQRVDIWALGVIMYELLSGALPFEGDSLPEIVALILEGQRKPLHGPNIPRGVHEAIDMCLQVDREQRFPTVSDLAAVLSPFASAEVRSASQRISLIVPPMGHGKRAPRRPPPLLLVVGLTVVAAAGAAGVGYWASRPNSTRSETGALSAAPTLVSTTTAAPTIVAEASSSTPSPMPHQVIATSTGAKPTSEVKSIGSATGVAQKPAAPVSTDRLHKLSTDQLR